MNILVIGCGKLGSALCNKLSKMGHDISVISSSPEDFNQLSTDFNGFTTVGVAIDQDVMRRAGIESCDAVAAVTNDDNSNLMVVQLAKQIFNVPKALARVNDPKKNDMFKKMGVDTICPTNMTVAKLASELSGEETSANVMVGNHSMIITQTELEKKMIGRRVSELIFEDNEMLVAVEHEDGEIENVFLKNYELVKGDSLICARFIG